jgi:hypothetical protein
MNETRTIVFAVPSGEHKKPGERAELSGREGAGFVRLEAESGDLVELEIVNGPTLLIHPERAAELFAAQQAPTRSSGSDVVVPTRLAWSAAKLDRGHSGGPSEIGQVVLSAFKIVKATVESKGANLATSFFARTVDQRVAMGLRRAAEAPDLSKPPEPPGLSGRSGKPLLVLLHGTFNTTLESFARLWDHPGLLASLNEAFDVYAFDHATLTESPLKNALELAKLLPVGAQITFLTYSRGGLVAEVLAQLAGDLSAGEATDTSWFQDAKYRSQLGELEELVNVMRDRKLEVERIVRVACPARGTLLASTRLDVYLSILKWGLKLAQVPVAPALLDFAQEVAKRRTKPDELPGLECMMPESGFIRWLNQADREIAGKLFVVAGDLQADSLTSWLKTLVSDSFFWTDNDLVVQTRSMYGGRPRAGGSRYYLERGGKVTHFNYYANRPTALAIQRALTQAKPAEFRAIGKLSSEGLSSSGGRAAFSDVIERSKAKDKPAVIVLPGIMGSQLKVDDELVWLSRRVVNGLERLSYAGSNKVDASDWMAGYYDELAEHLTKSHEVVPFPFDWRKPIEEEAVRLAAKIDETLRGRTEPVRILAHSLGGLVARTVEKVAPDVWQKLIEQENGRLLLLGPPNGGSWAPMQVLSGDNLVGNLVAYVGALFRDHEVRELFAAWPGFIQLQAGLLDPTLGLDRAETWQRLAEADRTLWERVMSWHNLPIQRQSLSWGLPKKDVLDQAKALHTFLAQQDLQRYGSRVVMVVGNADETPSGYEADVAGPDAPSFNYLHTSRGDGTVTLANALLRGVRAFQVNVEHSKLPSQSELYEGYVNLLETGTPEDARFTSLLSMRGRESVSLEASVRAPRRVARLRAWSDDELDTIEGTLTLPASGPPLTNRASTPALKISVVNGDLTFVNQPLMLGHYRSLALTGAEKVMDDFLGGSMTRGLLLRGYATQPGEARVFDNHQQDQDDPHAVPRPPAVVVVGLGAEGELRAEDLITTVRQGVIEYVRSRGNDSKQASSFELATVLIGSGGMGIAVATAARAVAQGVCTANERLLEQNAPIVSQLHVIELYEDRACEALRELLDVAERRPAAFEVEPWLKTGTKPLTRPLTSSYRGADYDMVSVLDGPSRDGKGSIVFAIDTRRARTEVRSSTTQLPLLQALIDQAQDDRHGEGKLGKSLFRMLVPRELDSFFGSSEAVLLQLDAATAGVPWELLNVQTDHGESGGIPWSIRAKLLRKLQTAQFREHPVPSGPEAKVLVIGDPHVDDRSQYRALPGAQSEARAVAKVFGVQALIGPTAVEAVNALLDQDYSVVHIAGHGREDGSGVVLSDSLVLGGDLVKSMRRLPDLVFVNTCYSARQRVGALPEQAATLARALIEAGVRCVIATGWAVDDSAARHFAETLYNELLRQRKFVEAIATARESTWRAHGGSNTWAAYQCYGDPDWLLKQRASAASDAAKPAVKSSFAAEAPAPPEARIVSAKGLLVALETLALRGGEKSKERAWRLEAEMDRQFGHLGEVAEAFADTYAQLGMTKEAIRWYDRAVRSERGATFRSLEQFFNLTVRDAANEVEKCFVSWEAVRGQGKDVVSAAKADLARGVAAAKQAFESCDDELQALAALPSSSERASLIGSAWKRKAMVAYAEQLALEGNRDSVLEALDQSRWFYEKAAEIANSERGKNASYPQLNALTVQLVRALVAGQSPQIEPPKVAALQKNLELWADEKQEFWPFVQAIELDVYAAVSTQRVAAELKRLSERFTDLFMRMANPYHWDSVRNQARFLLRPYRALAGPVEKEATNALQRLLDDHAEIKP